MSEKPNQQLDLAAIRARLDNAKGPQFWQSLEALAETDDFKDFLYREFPRQASEWVDDEPGRRKFLKLMGASLALAGVTACTRQPEEKIMPYVRAPEEIVPGKPLYFATAMPMNGVAMGVLAESHMGRPTKVEGNPEHPASLGSADIFMQASILGMYDPDRLQTVMHYGEISSFPAFSSEMMKLVAAAKLNRGAKLRILTETVTSPTLGSQLNAFLTTFPEAKWHQWEPAGAHAARSGAMLAFGAPVNTYYNLQNADVILSLDSNFMNLGPASIRYSRDFSARRRAWEKGAKRNRLYAVEACPSNTGSKADHRWPVKPSEVLSLAGAVAKELGVATGSIPTAWPASIPEAGRKALIDDLKAAKANAVVIPGEYESGELHALAHAINAALGSTAVVHTDPIEAKSVDQFASIKDLVDDLNRGAVDLLLVLGGNPVYNAPADLNFKDAFQKAKVRVTLGQQDDETSSLSHWQVPEAHYLESWGDLRAFDGTVTIQQPLIQPLFRGRTAIDLMTFFSDQPERPAHDVVQALWQPQHAADFESWWRKSVHDGVVAGSALPAKPAPAAKLDWAASYKAPAIEGIELSIQPDPTVYDGRFANNGWLQETPKPMSTVTWDNTAIISVAMAEKQKLQIGDVVEIKSGNGTVKAGVWILPGHAPDAVTVHLGYGRPRGGRVATGAGFNAYVLRTSANPWLTGAQLRSTGDSITIARTQGHWSMEGRHLVRSASFEQFEKEPGMIHAMAHSFPKEFTFFPDRNPVDPHAWGMAIDLTACNGCNACMVACVAENNIPVVGKEQVIAQREMHWIRVDRYFEGGLDNPTIHNQPVPCMQCENAPCEVVCPVAATVHSSEGLNDMVYNRCVGTRYCSNNCPYKVRRFNFLLYADFETEIVKLQKNPDVSVRSRGVMEKCTYCVQRINQARITAKREGRKVKEGEVVTACQQTCPTQAIYFGDLNDPNSAVSKMKQQQLNYGLLEDLNTRPRTTYLASLRNPNPAVPAPVSHENTSHH